MIDEKEVQAAQAAWGTGVVYIGAAELPEDAKERAIEFIRASYVLDGSLLFCPTMASEAPFRADLEGALSYFVGQNPEHSEDSGFALRPWTAVRFENQGIVVRKDMTIAMGHYFFLDSTGSETQGEYTFGYIRNELGDIQIQVHHSALPFAP